MSDVWLPPVVTEAERLVAEGFKAMTDALDATSERLFDYLDSLGDS